MSVLSRNLFCLALPCLPLIVCRCAASEIPADFSLIYPCQTLCCSTRHSWKEKQTRVCDQLHLPKPTHKPQEPAHNIHTRAYAQKNLPRSRMAPYNHCQMSTRRAPHPEQPRKRVHSETKVQDSTQLNKAITSASSNHTLQLSTPHRCSLPLECKYCWPSTGFSWSFQWLTACACSSCKNSERSKFLLHAMQETARFFGERSQTPYTRLCWPLEAAKLLSSGIEASCVVDGSPQHLGSNRCARVGTLTRASLKNHISSTTDKTSPRCFPNAVLDWIEELFSRVLWGYSRDP